MNTTNRICLCLLLAGMSVGLEARAADSNAVCRPVVELTDDSRVIGTPQITTLPVRADDSAAAASRDPAVVLPQLAKFTPALGLSYIREVLGEPDMDIGSASSLFIYRLTDGSTIQVRLSPHNRRANTVVSILREGTVYASRLDIYPPPDLWSEWSDGLRLRVTPTQRAFRAGIPPSFLVEAQVVQPLDVNLPFLFPRGTNSVIGPFTTLEVWVTNTVSGQAYLDQMDLLRQQRTFSLVADGVPLQRLVPATNAVGTFWLKGPFLPQAAVETLREAAKTKASVALDLLPKALGHLPAGKYTLTMKLGPPPADSLAGRYAAQAPGPIPARPVAWTGTLVVADVNFTIGAAGDASPTPATLADVHRLLAAAAGGQWKLTGHWLAGTYDGHLRYSIIPNPQTSTDGRAMALELVTRHSFRQQVIGISEQFLLIGTGDAGAELGGIAKQLGLTLLIEPRPDGGHKLMKQTVTFGGATNILTACSLKEFIFAPNPGPIALSNGLAGGGKRWDQPPVLRHGVDSPANLLVAAAKQGDNAALERLLDEGTPSDARNADGQSALELAVANGHREAVLVLLGRCAPAGALEWAFERECTLFYWGSLRKAGMATAIQHLAPRHRDQMVVMLCCGRVAQRVSLAGSFMGVARRSLVGAGCNRIELVAKARPNGCPFRPAKRPAVCGLPGKGMICAAPTATTGARRGRSRIRMFWMPAISQF